ncbi:MAG: hypothetical protein ABJN26_28485 [Stappiaceae bacterium]
MAKLCPDCHATIKHVTERRYLQLELLPDLTRNAVLIDQWGRVVDAK